ncbi:MAG: hypothetical protein WDM70_11700 [Nitrosomonadales bacterium]
MIKPGHKNTPEILSAIEIAVSAVEPLLKQTRNYPDAYLKPVVTAMEYAHSMAQSVPGPVAINLDSYAKDAFVHAIFPAMDLVADAFRASRALQNYFRDSPSTEEAYALMGMRRQEKTAIGMELSGQVIQQDVPQQIVYFNDHTIVDPAPSEQQARDRVAKGFFNNLVGKVAARIASRKQQMHDQLLEMDLLKARLRASDTQSRPKLKKELSAMLASMQNTSRSLDLRDYPDDFEAVLLNPEQHLRLDQSSMILDSMGVRRNSSETISGELVVFNDLIGFDRRSWTVTMVHCSNIKSESFAARLETAYRRLSI